MIADTRAARHTFSPSAGIVLSYLEAGDGPPMVLVPGRSQTAAEFGKQIDVFADHYHVYALDQRGHGESRTVGSGLRVSRLAADLHAFVSVMELTDVVLLGHAMGCAIIWSSWDQFGGGGIRQLILVDQPAAMTRTTLWSDRDRIELGAGLTPRVVFQIAARVVGPDGRHATVRAVESMFSSAISKEDKAWFLSENLKTPRSAAGRLFVDEALADWREVVPSIDVPTLVTAGEISLYPVAGPGWVAAHIGGARFRVFTEEEKGSHFVFWENPIMFNAVVLDFLASTR
jgi:non-heme chloroperoxidase